MVYRDDRDALQARAEALEIELQDAKEEIERLRKKNTQVMSLLRMIAESRQQQELLERAGVTFDKGVPRIRTEPPPKPNEVAAPKLPPPPRVPESARPSAAPPKLFERNGMVASKIPSVMPPRPSAPPSAAPQSQAPPSESPRSHAPPSSAVPREPIAIPIEPGRAPESVRPGASAQPSAPPPAAPPRPVELEGYYPREERRAPSVAPAASRGSERPPSPEDEPRTGTNAIVRVDGEEQRVPISDSTRPPRDSRAPGIYRINKPPPPRETTRPRRRRSRPR